MSVQKEPSGLTMAILPTGSSRVWRSDCRDFDRRAGQNGVSAGIGIDSYRFIFFATSIRREDAGSVCSFQYLVNAAGFQLQKDFEW